MILDKIRRVDFNGYSSLELQFDLKLNRHRVSIDNWVFHGNMFVKGLLRWNKSFSQLYWRSIKDNTFFSVTLH